MHFFKKLDTNPSLLVIILQSKCTKLKKKSMLRMDFKYLGILFWFLFLLLAAVGPWCLRTGPLLLPKKCILKSKKGDIQFNCDKIGLKHKPLYSSLELFSLHQAAFPNKPRTCGSQIESKLAIASKAVVLKMGMTILIGECLRKYGKELSGYIWH